MVNPLIEPFCVLRRNRKAYLILNAAFYGLVGLGVTLAAIYPDVHRQWLLSAKLGVLNGGSGVVSIVRMIQDGTPIALPIVLIFLVNLLDGAFLTVSLPSLVIPFLGCAALAFRMVLWGMTFGAEYTSHPLVLGLILLEGQGYVLAAFAAYLQGVQFLWPARYGFSTRKEAFTTGLWIHVRFYALIAAVLLIAASYEALVIRAATSVIPAEAVTSPEQDFQGPSLRLNYSGSLVYYSPEVRENDAKLAGVLLEDMHYFTVARPGKAHLEKTEDTLQLQVFLKASYWNDPDIVQRFYAMRNEFRRACPGLRYEVVLYDFDREGVRHEKRL